MPNFSTNAAIHQTLRFPPTIHTCLLAQMLFRGKLRKQSEAWLHSVAAPSSLTALGLASSHNVISSNAA